MREKLLAYSQLVRLPNWFTAMADVMAGTLLVMGTQIRWGELLALLGATSFIYGGGCVLNDLRDSEVDRKERPFRPLPSGRVTAMQALVLLGALFAGGLGLSYQAGVPSFVVAILLVSCVCSYDLLTKSMPLAGPLNMGLCRGLNLLLGMSPSLALAPWSLLFPCITVCYVFSLTALSRFEVAGESAFTGLTVALAWLGMAGAILGLVMNGSLLPGCLVYLMALIVFTGRPLLAALASPIPGLIEKAVKALVLAIPLLDAIYASGVQGWVFGIPVLLCMVPALIIARRLYVT